MCLNTHESRKTCSGRCDGCPNRKLERTTGTIDIREAVTEEDREAVFRFRYKVYVEEMRRNEQYADHVNMRIEEPLDAGNTVFAAMRGGEVVGTVRVHPGTVTDGFYADFYRMPEFAPFFPEQTSITTKLMVDQVLRRSSVAVRLAMAGFEYARSKGIRFDFIDCNAHLKRFFERLGYHQLFPEREHHVYGTVHPMVLDTQDWFHFLRIRSPFAELLPDDGSIAPVGWKSLLRKKRNETDHRAVSIAA